ncbi:EAL domain-containing protein [Acidovorax sp. sif1233]|uniref:putative bifunctional diguanylate cyclase/phosphodiesterase n=1 Tax=unclassified Acidovorax TaxID=2684926 RepID=UPI001C43A988|nr:MULTISPECIES: EAL domain-containing protein [unclassified Acidovorax]MBV7429192.1 EAL domain-containing protein [Acidovorax sp. sif0732]MBV7451018.1 EAL domain-containing protein [Acidovorax sp. sif0715]MBV7453979.1 EAL domain-containing protein [Acidovorax sp. sif1233]
MNTFMPSSYNLFVVAASFAIAMLASYVTLDLARRVRTAQRRVGLAWWAAGSIVMGTGIWSMHFLGMQAFRLPIEIGFAGGLTLLSWLAAVAASAMALQLASRTHFGRMQLALGALVMGAGISGMHYIGMAAMEMAPGIVWNLPLVALSVLIAVLASATALLIFKLLRRVRPSQRLPYQLAASFVMAVAICGMHYTGMAAASFAMGSVCLSAGELGGPGLTAMVLMATGMLLVSTLFTSILDARLQATAERLTRSLQDSNTRLQAANDELQKRAFADALTGLPNRLLFEDRLIHALLRLDRTNHHRVEDRLAVLFVDLDGFKPINDSFGHAAGDVILRSAADRLRREAREGDTVARVGGDEFLILLEDVSDVADCVTVANRVLSSLSQPFEVSGKQVQIACSIGVVVHPDHGDRNKLVANADAAMYAAKRAGGGCYALFEPHMGSDASEQLELQNDLRQALDRGELALHYQPKIDGTRGQISGVEALLRWNHPKHGMVSPVVFIALAERFGLIGRLGNWVINEACRQVAEWARSGMRMRVAINLSVHQLRESGLAERIGQALLRHGVDASQLLCEITESVAMEDIKATQRTFDGLARIGVFLSIDDFGTGYSSLNYLRQLPAQQLKIDRSFVNDLESSEDARAVVAAVVSLAHALGLRVVAEGVETSGQRDILLGMGCDELQGFFYARPMPADTLLAWSQGEKPVGSADFTPSVIGTLPDF